MRISRLTAILATVVLGACAPRQDVLLAPAPSGLDAAAPDSFLVDFNTTKGHIVVAAHRSWSPHGVDRFHWLVTHQFYDDARFFRAVPNFVVQFGLTGRPAVDSLWEKRGIADDPVRASNVKGMLSFARGGLASRSTQLFFNLRDNSRLDTLPPKGANGQNIGFPPIGKIVQGLAVLDALYKGYGDEMRGGAGPKQDSISVRGNAYLDQKYPKLDRIITARVTRAWK